MAGQESEAALDGVTVLELGEHVAAPFCGKLLALYGATVIKIEPPAGDPARRLGPFPDGQPHHELGALWLYLNTGKQSVVLDLDQEAGRRIARDLAAQADLLVTNYPAGWLADRGLDDATLRGRNPRLVYLALSAFGADGPWSGWQATNLTSYAAGGQMHRPAIRTVHRSRQAASRPITSLASTVSAPRSSASGTRWRAAQGKRSRSPRKRSWLRRSR